MELLVSEMMLEVWAILGTLLGTLLLVAALLWASTRVLAQGRAAWAALRGHVPDVLAAVDEPGDRLNAQLGRLTRVPPAVWAAFLPAFVEALAAGLDRALAEPSRSHGEGDGAAMPVPRQET